MSRWPDVLHHYRHFFLFAWILNVFRWNLGEVITFANRWTDYTSWAKLYDGEGSRMRQKTRVDIKPVLPRSEWLHKFHSTYDALRPQGWRVHYIHLVAETLYDHAQSFALIQCMFLYVSLMTPFVCHLIKCLHVYAQCVCICVGLYI